MRIANFIYPVSIIFKYTGHFLVFGLVAVCYYPTLTTMVLRYIEMMNYE